MLCGPIKASLPSCGAVRLTSWSVPVQAGSSSLNAVPKFTTFELEELIYRLFVITASCSIMVAWCTSVET